MKKSVLLGSLIVASVLSLASCGRSTSSSSVTTGKGEPSVTTNSTGSTGPTTTPNETSNAVNDDTNALKSVDWAKFKNDTASKTKVTFWVQNGTAKYYSNYEKSFESIYKGVDLTIAEKGSYSDIDNAIRQGAAAGDVPTMALTYPDYTVNYIKNNGLALNMLPYMNNESEGFGKDDPKINGVQSSSALSDIVPAYISEGQKYTLNNKVVSGQYTLPFAKSTEFMVVNKQQVTAAAKLVGKTYEDFKTKLGTWEGLWEVASAMQGLDTYKAKQPALQSHVAPLAYEDDTNMYITLSQQLGIPYVQGDSADHFPFYTTGQAQSVKLLKDLNDKYNKGLFMTGDTTGLTGEDAYVTSMFAAQKVGLCISTTAGLSWEIPDYGSTSDTPTFDVDVLPMPTSSTNWVDGGKALTSDAKPSAAISQGPSVVFLNKQSIDEKAAGWLFYKFMTNDINSASWSVAGSYAPTRNSVYTNAGFLSSLEPSEGDDIHTKSLKKAKKAMYQIIKDYGTNGDFYTTDVFVGSSAARSAIGTCMTGVIQKAGITDDQIKAQLKVAYDAGVKASL